MPSAWRIKRPCAGVFPNMFGSGYSFSSGRRAASFLVPPPECFNRMLLSFTFSIWRLGIPASISVSLAEKMRRHEAEELARGDDLSILPEPWKVPHVPSHQVVGTGSIGTFDKHIVLWIVRYLNCPHGFYEMSSLSDQIEKLLPRSLSNL